MSSVDAFGASLLGSSGVQFNAIAQHVLIRSDFSEHESIPNAGVKSRTLVFTKCQESPDALGPLDWERIKAQTFLGHSGAWLVPPCGFRQLRAESLELRLADFDGESLEEVIEQKESL